MKNKVSHIKRFKSFLNPFTTIKTNNVQLVRRSSGKITYKVLQQLVVRRGMTEWVDVPIVNEDINK
jgi:hypothetical protein